MVINVVKAFLKDIARRVCVDLGASQRVDCSEHSHSFFPLFSYLWNLLPYEAELIFHSAWPLPWSHLQCQLGNAALPPALHPAGPVTCKSLLREEALNVGSFISKGEPC